MAARLVIGMTGGEGLAYGVRLLETLRDTAFETHLALSEDARAALGPQAEVACGLADRVHAVSNLAAPISSGSFRTQGMIVAPCSARALAAIVSGLATNLLYRAADVTLKEGRTLVLGLSGSALGPIGLEHLARAALVPGLEVVSLEGSADEAVARLLAPFAAS